MPSPFYLFSCGGSQMLPFKRKLFWGLEYPFKPMFAELLDGTKNDILPQSTRIH